MNGIFIAGTGTGVGKTHVTGLLLGALRRRGIDTLSVKPVQTGCLPGEAAPDLLEHWRLAGWRPTAEIAARCAPYCFTDPVSPHLAAAREGRRVGVSEIVASVEALAAHTGAQLLVEGAGGVLVPLNGRETQRDLIAALGLPVLVVAEAGLGTINHTLLTLEALARVNAHVLGVVLNPLHPAEPFLIENNAATIAAITSVEVVTLRDETALETLRALICGGIA